MIEQAKNAVTADVAELLTRYSFDLQAHSLDRWIDQWLRHYPPEWVISAIIEALYQGRYKAVSVWQILDLWRRRGRPLRHFSRDFERIVFGRPLQLLFSPSQQTLISVPERSLILAEANGDRARNRIDSDWHDEESAHSKNGSAEQVLVSPNSTIISATPALVLSSGTASKTVHQPTPIEPFKPSQQFQLTLPGELNRARSLTKSPIQQFVPTPEPSELHGKLKSIAQNLLMANAQATSDALEAERKPQPNPESNLEADETGEISERDDEHQAEE
jgi:hypothetical protein